ncbi:MAG TPA: methyltransferase domain-containing protein [Gammaproteobacteria bacterium]|nr:methyltransferase domain-containing protein [Gammaproteobacteria bacterium]
MHGDVQAWWQTKTAAYLLRQERIALGETLPTLFGYYLVQSGSWGPPGVLLEASTIRTKVIVAEHAEAGCGLLGDPSYLPLASDSVDVVLLPHTLERVEEPEKVLREAERVLHGEGHVVVLGFHPLGPWGIGRYIGVRHAWNGRFLSLWRLRIWLKVLGFEIEEVQQMLFRPPWRSKGMLLRSAFLDRLRWRQTAGAYMVVARKRVFSMTPLRRVRTRPPAAFSGVAKPTTRSMG